MEAIFKLTVLFQIQNALKKAIMLVSSNLGENYGKIRTHLRSSCRQCTNFLTLMVSLHIAEEKNVGSVHICACNRWEIYGTSECSWLSVVKHLKCVCCQCFPDSVHPRSIVISRAINCTVKRLSKGNKNKRYARNL